MKKIVDAFDREKNNEMIEQGFIYKVNSWKEIKSSRDPWSGMPDIETTWNYFDNEAEAVVFAKEQKYPFSGENAIVETATRMETWDEMEQRRIREKEEKDAKKAAKIAEKAAAAGMTIEEYQAEQKKIATIKRYNTEIKKRKAEIEKIQKEIKAIEKKIKKVCAN